MGKWQTFPLIGWLLWLKCVRPGVPLIPKHNLPHCLSGLKVVFRFRRLIKNAFNRYFASFLMIFRIKWLFYFNAWLKIVQLDRVSISVSSYLLVHCTFTKSYTHPTRQAFSRKKTLRNSYDNFVQSSSGIRVETKNSILWQIKFHFEFKTKSPVFTFLPYFPPVFRTFFKNEFHPSKCFSGYLNFRSDFWMFALFRFS